MLEGEYLFEVDGKRIQAGPDLAAVVPVFHKHGLELLGPPLAAREVPATALA